MIPFERTVLIRSRHFGRIPFFRFHQFKFCTSNENSTRDIQSGGNRKDQAQTQLENVNKEYHEKFRALQQGNKTEELVNLYQSMVAEKIKPDFYTFHYLLLPLGKSYQNQNYLKFILSEMKLQSVKYPSRLLLTVLINLEKENNWEKIAEITEDLMECENIEKDILVYNTLLRIYIKAKKDELIKYLVNDMNKNKIIINLNTIKLLFNYLCEKRMTSSIELLFSLVKTQSKQEDQQKIGDIYFYNDFLTYYAKLNDAPKLFEIFEEINRQNIETNAFTFMTIIDTLSKLKLKKELSEFYANFVQIAESNSKVMEPRIVKSFLKAFQSIKDWEMIESIYQFVKKNANTILLQDVTNASSGMSHGGPPQGTTIFITLVEIYAKENNFQKMREMLSEFIDLGFTPDCGLFNNLIHVFGKAGKLEEMEQTYKELKATSLQPTVVTYTSLLSAYTHANRFDDAERIITLLRHENLLGDAICCASLLFAYGKAGKIDKMRNLFTSLLENGFPPELPLFHALISGYATVNDVQNIESVIKNMKNYNLKPTVFAYNTLFDCYVSLKDLGSMYEKLSEMIDIHHIAPNYFTFHTLLNCFCNYPNYSHPVSFVCSLIDEYSTERSLPFYTSLFKALCAVDESQKLFVYFEKLLQEGLTPNIYTFNSILSAASKSYTSDEIENILMVMNEKKIEYDQYTYNILIEFYCKNGKLVAANNLMKDMQKKGLKPDITTFNSFLKFYSRTSNTENMIKIYEKVKELNIFPNKITYHLLLSNLQRIGDTKFMMQIFEELKNSQFPADFLSLYERALTSTNELDKLEEVKKHYQTVKNY